MLRAAILEDAEAGAWLERVETRTIDGLAPDLIWAEVGQTLRRYVRTRRLAEPVANEAMARLLRFPIVDEPMRPLAPVALDLAGKHSLSVYDAFYLALAEAAGATLVTADRRLAAVASDVAFLT